MASAKPKAARLAVKTSSGRLFFLDLSDGRVLSVETVCKNSPD